MFGYPNVHYSKSSEVVDKLYILECNFSIVQLFNVEPLPRTRVCLCIHYIAFAWSANPQVHVCMGCRFDCVHVSVQLLEDDFLPTFLICGHINVSITIETEKGTPCGRLNKSSTTTTSFQRVINKICPYKPMSIGNYFGINTKTKTRFSSCSTADVVKKSQPLHKSNS